jgi:hypothetical protein
MVLLQDDLIFSSFLAGVGGFFNQDEVSQTII